MKVLYPNVLVKPDPKKEKLDTGLIVSLTKLDLPSSGVIEDAPSKSQYSKGDRVTMDPFAGHEIEINNQKYLVINELDVYGEII